MIRKATNDDYDAVWEIFHLVIKTGDTYVFWPDTPKNELSSLWFGDSMHTYVWEEEKEILGTYFMKANQPGLGNHIVNAGYMVHPKAQGKGIGQKLCEHSLNEAKQFGFTGMQFNVVVSTNTNAIKLWKKLGFRMVGTIPKGFRHQQLGKVDIHIMHREI